MEAAQIRTDPSREDQGRHRRGPDVDLDLDIDRALRRAAEHLASLQRLDGSWEGEMVWCTMILSQYIIVHRIINGPDAPALKDERARAGMIRHFEVTRTREGTWGLHGESGGYVFTTALAYVALRLLGLGKDHPLCAPALRFLRDQPGGVLSVPTWGKLWLALCDLYGWEGVNPPAGDLPPAGVAAGPPQPLLLPHPLHLPGHRLPLRQALPRAAGPHHPGAARGTLPRGGLRADRLRGAPARPRGHRPLRAAQRRAARGLRRARGV